MSKTKLVRMDKEVERKLKNIMEERYQKGLSNIKEINIPESLRLAVKTPSWKGVEMELRTMPKNRSKR